jgi:hypothetical protein
MRAATSASGTFRTCLVAGQCLLMGGRPDMPLNPRHFRFSPTSEVGDGIR